MDMDKIIIHPIQRDYKIITESVAKCNKVHIVLVFILFCFGIFFIMLVLILFLKKFLTNWHKIFHGLSHSLISKWDSLYHVLGFILSFTRWNRINNMEQMIETSESNPRINPKRDFFLNFRFPNPTNILKYNWFCCNIFYWMKRPTNTYQYFGLIFNKYCILWSLTKYLPFQLN